MHTSESLHAALDALNIPYTIHHHPPMHTVADGIDIVKNIPGAHIKNLFVKDKAHNLWLIVALQSRALNLVALGKYLGCKDRLSFANEETLWQHLGVKPGSVSPLDLINTVSGAVNVVLDDAIFDAELVNPHPLRNDQTTSLAPTDLMRALAHWGHTPLRLNLGMFPKEPK
jgi:Ala-tRNA(Pro) deacylase